MEIIHGDNQIQSRNYLNLQVSLARQKGQEIIRLDGQKVGLTEIIQATGTSSLFGQEKVVIIENLLSRVRSAEKEQIITEISQSQGNLILWEEKEISSASLKKLGPKFTPRFFKTPVILFKFLDSFYPGNKNCLVLYRQVLAEQPAELVFYLLAKRLRQLIICQDGEAQNLGLAPWQIAKLKSQAGKFTPAGLLDFYNQLLQIDFKVKTGQSKQDLTGLLLIIMSEVL